MCIWKTDIYDMYQEYFNTTCGHNKVYMSLQLTKFHKFTYCPFCGEKIKEVKNG